jgi:hypothetical protein
MELIEDANDLLVTHLSLDQIRPVVTVGVAVQTVEVAPVGQLDLRIHDGVRVGRLRVHV